MPVLEWQLRPLPAAWGTQRQTQVQQGSQHLVQGVAAQTLASLRPPLPRNVDACVMRAVWHPCVVLLACDLLWLLD